MKPLNQPERNQRWGQFLGLYVALLLFVTLCCWLSVSLIPRLTSVQQNQTAQEMMAYKKQLAGTDKMLVAVEQQSSLLTDNWLRSFYANTSALDQQFPKPLFMATTNSYRQLAGEYENAKKEGDEGLQLLNSQKIQLEAKKAALLAALAAAGDELKVVAAAPKLGAPKLPPPPAGPVINPGQFGPFKPLLISGSGEFGKNTPEINASVQFMIVRDHQVVLGVYFETGGPDAGTLGKITERKELYTAPPGFKIVGLSVPERTPWRINYVDKTAVQDKFEVGEGLMTLFVNGNTPGLDIGATGGSTLSVQLKKQIKVELEKE